MKVYLKEVRVERIAPLAVKFTCPVGHETIRRWKSTWTNVGEIDWRVKLWQQGQIRFTCDKCDAGPEQKEINFDDIMSMI